jgi:hypothetical protein
MEVLEYVLVALGAIGLVMGYRKNSRNVLLGSALVLCVALGMTDFVAGVQHGYQVSHAHQV